MLMLQVLELPHEERLDSRWRQMWWLACVLRRHQWMYGS
jgi:hypothetical protein